MDSTEGAAGLLCADSYFTISVRAYGVLVQ